MAYNGTCEVKQRKDGRWIIVYGKDSETPGKQYKGTKDYPTREAATAAMNKLTGGQDSFDRYTQDVEPELEGGDGMLGDAGDSLANGDEPETEDNSSEEEAEQATPAVKADGKTIIVLILNSKGMIGH